jgi:hypothetical protein
MHRTAAPGADLLLFWQSVFNTLDWKVLRNWLAPGFLSFVADCLSDFFFCRSILGNGFGFVEQMALFFDATFA